ncbi:hypothetical protein Mame01_46420 [Microbispora amethystogenes]|nr:hypothetical protein Mame01_46420 [Microbispora amethystogenes]
MDPISLGTRALRRKGSLRFVTAMPQGEYSVIATTVTGRFGGVTLASWDQEEAEWRSDTFIAQFGPAGWTTDGHMSGGYLPGLNDIRIDWPWLSGPPVREDSRHVGWIETESERLCLCCIGFWCHPSVATIRAQTSLGEARGVPSPWRLALILIPCGEEVDMTVKDKDGLVLEESTVYEQPDFGPPSDMRWWES